MKSQADLYKAEERATYGEDVIEDWDMIVLTDDDSGEE